MRRFESIVMSETEPVPDGTLWLRKKRTTISNEDPDSKKPFGYDIWWFGPIGWQPLFDADTRYEYINHTVSGVTSEVPIITEQTKYPKIGKVDIDTTYSIYNGDRALGSHTNLVNETGLKKHVDDLQSQIDALTARVVTLEGQVATLQQQVSNNNTRITSNSNSITTLSGRVSALESH